MDTKTSTEIVNGQVARLILNYMIRFKNSYQVKQSKLIEEIPEI